MTQPTSNSNVAKFMQLWAENLAAVLIQSGVSSAVGTAGDLESATLPQGGDATGTAMRFFCGGQLRGELVCHAEAASALPLSQTLMSETVDPAAAFGDEQKDGFAEFIRQAAGLTATGWKKLTGAETVLSFQSVAEPKFVADRSTVVQLSGTSFPEVTLQFQLNEELIRCFEALSAANELAAAAPVTTASNPGTTSGEGSVGNLELLLDIELDATIRFGKRELRLREVLGLMPGTVVELDQMVNEPADLLIAGRTVAKGEVVVVDGNFGLRVTEVVSRAHRASLVPLP